MDKDYYKVLDISKTCSQEEIAKKFKDLARKYHPDKNPNDKIALEKFKNISEAYDTLGDPIKRKFYDEKYSFSNDYNFFNDLFKNNSDDMFTSFNKKPRKKESKKGSNIDVNLDITIKDVFLGTIKNIIIKRDIFCSYCDSTGAKSVKRCTLCKGSGLVNSILGVDDCRKCNGSGVIIEVKCHNCLGSGLLKKEETVEIKISRNVELIRIPLKGNNGKNNGLAGDLIIKLNIKSDEKYSKNNDDLILNEYINISDLVLGTTIKISNFEESIEVVVPKGHNFEKMLRIKEKGFYTSKIRGNFYIKLIPIIPTNLTEEQESLYRKLREIDSSVVF